MKICSKCKINKEFSFFYKRKDTKDGYRADCKECHNKSGKEYLDLNREKVKKYKNKFYLENIDIIKERSNKWCDENKERFKEISKKYRDKETTKIKNMERYLENKEYYLSKNKENKIKNKDKLNENNRIKYNSDTMYRLKFILRNIISKSIKRNGYRKKSRSELILGCSFENFLLHIESKFELWMTWENYGKYNDELNYGWDIDHIIPSSSAISEEEIIKLNHFTNLQPLCSKINRDIKSNKLIWNYSTLI